MAVSLLPTKLHIPRARANGVSRPRLTKRLLAGAAHPYSFVLLSGPAGFGKTTLLSEFINELKQPVAWVSLDEGDNDPIRFWTYLITACQSIQRGVGESGLALLQTLPSFPDETIPTLLINDLVKLETDLVLVLDDYHFIQNPSIHAGLAFLLDHLPEKLHLILSTRVDPPWPMARFRARDQLVEIRAVDLRFTTEEIAAFLNQVMGLDLRPEDITALERRTEGWIASLQLAALSLRGRSDVTGFIKAFTGSHVYVAEYLIQEVLEQQPAEVRNFLLQTSVLDSLKASLCEAVTRCQDGEAMLKSLYQANLFLLPLDEEGGWFRYHQLFLDLLRARLQQSLPADAIAALHRGAAAWYEQAGMTNEAIAHTLAAGDYSHAVQLVETVAVPMILNAYFKTVEDWLHAIPPEYLTESLQANMAFAWMYLMRQNFSRAAPHLERLQAIFSTRRKDTIDATLQGEWLALQSIILNAQGKAAESRDMAEQALNILPQEEAQVRSMVYLGLVTAYEQMLDYDRAREAAEAIIQHGRSSGDLASEIVGSSLLGRMVLQQGGLHSAYDITTQALHRVEQTGSFSPFSATLFGELAQVHYHWYQLKEAREYFSLSVQWSTLGGFSDAEIYHSVFLSRLFQMEGDLKASLKEIEKALDLMQTAAPALVGEEVIAQQISIFLAVDHPVVAQTALRSRGFLFEDGFSYPELAPDVSLPHALGLLYNSALRVLLYQAKTKREHKALKSGIELADRVIAGSLRCRHLPIALQTLLLQAQLYFAQGDERAGLAEVVRALELAEPEGFISVFIEEGRPIAEALGTLLKRNMLGTVRGEYVREILAAFPQTQAVKPVAAREAAAPEESLIEPLTARELEVLQHIALGDSNQVIADKLVITLSAVKKHTGNIFRKLNVNSRTQAVLRARQLGLLDAAG